MQMMGAIRCGCERAPECLATTTNCEKPLTERRKLYGQSELRVYDVI